MDEKLEISLREKLFYKRHISLLTELTLSLSLALPVALSLSLSLFVLYIIMIVSVSQFVSHLSCLFSGYLLLVIIPPAPLSWRKKTSLSMCELCQVRTPNGWKLGKGCQSG